MADREKVSLHAATPPRHFSSQNEQANERASERETV
jgi:hypothetical protein